MLFATFSLASLASAQEARPQIRQSPITEVHVLAKAPPAALATAKAITELGAAPTSRQVSDLVFSAVRTSPDEVLDIVHSAVVAAPEKLAPEIVAAAAAAVPDPWKQVVYHKYGIRPKRHGEPDFKSTSDYKGGPDPIYDLENVDGTVMTLAEAIAQTAADARSGLDLSGLQNAVDRAIVGDPSRLLRAVLSPTGISGVGDAGTNNYANEPLRPPTIVAKPTPAPVSR